MSNGDVAQAEQGIPIASVETNTITKGSFGFGVVFVAVGLPAIDHQRNSILRLGAKRGLHRNLKRVACIGHGIAEVAIIISVEAAAINTQAISWKDLSADNNA